MHLGPMRPHAVQSALWRDPYRFKIVPAGRRSGKTELLKRRVLRALFEPKPWPDPRYFIAAPVHHQARRIYWDWFKRHVPRVLIDTVSETNTMIRLVSGAELWIFGMDRPERAEGVPWDGCGLDEYANMKAEAWQANIRPSLSDRKGWAWLIGVPEGLNHYYELWLSAAKPENRESWGRYSWPSADILPAEEVEAARRDLDLRTFRQEYEASFESASGRVYYAFDRNLDVSDFAVPERGVQWRVGMDFNVNPMSAIVGWHDEASGVVTVWREYEIPTSSTEEMAERLRADGFGSAIVYPDATGSALRTSAGGQSDISILKLHGFKVRAHDANPRVRDRVNAVNTRICTATGLRRLRVHPRCAGVIKALEGLTYRHGTSEPDKSSGYDHITDALGYWIEYEFPVRHASAETGKF